MTNVNGGMWFDPVLGDQIRRVETTPQVMAYINKIPTHCSGTCGYQWQQSQTPTITGISPNTGNEEAKSKKYRGLLKVKSRVKTRQVQGIWSQQFRAQARPQKDGKEPGVWKGKRWEYEE